MISLDVAEELDHGLFPEVYDDPRASFGWSAANRWPGDGAGFLVSQDGRGMVAVRRLEEHNGWSRMNATDVCAGAGRDVCADRGVLTEARREGRRQLNVAALGYGQSLWLRDESAACVEMVLNGVLEQAAHENRQPAFLHLGPGDPAIPLLRDRGWHVGLTDTYAVLTDLGASEAEWLGQLRSGKRRRVRADTLALEASGCSVQIYRGDSTGPIQGRVAELEALSDQRHGLVGDPGRLRRVNERLAHLLGDAFAIAAMHTADGVIVASATLALGRACVLPRMVGLADESWQGGGYFHVGYYAPMRLAREIGAASVLLGVGSLTPKLLRGARLVPLYSAVPPSAPAHAALLLGTQACLQDRHIDDLGGSAPEDIRRPV